MARVNWKPELIDFFVNALVDECRAGNRPQKTLNNIGKDNVVQRMTDHTGRRWKWSTCKNKWDELRKKWSCWRRLIKLSGVTFHPETKLIDMPPEWWAAQIAANPLAKGFQHSRLEYEDQLNFIFAKIEPVNIGSDELGGHEGGRAGPPTHYLNSDDSDDSEEHLPVQLPSPLPSQPRRTSSMSASGKRQSSDPMASTVEFWGGFKHFHQEVSASKKQKLAAGSSNQIEEDHEYDAFMMELLDAGIDPESNEYFMASM
ncbi:hypothetical protein BS78_K050800, partial [Paspalum vaginatum]